MDILRDLHRQHRGVQMVVRQRRQLAAVVSCDADDRVPLRLGVLHRVQDVFAVAAAGNRDHQIPRLQVTLQLEAEHLLKADVVRDGHQRGDVVVQALEAKLFLRVLGDALVKIVLVMAGRRAAAAVAENIDRAAPPVRRLQLAHHGVHRVHVDFV